MYFGHITVHVFLPLPSSHVRIGGGFRENLFGWFCALFAPLFAPFQLHLCHELTIGAGYHPNMSSANGIEESWAWHIIGRDCFSTFVNMSN